MTDDTARFQNIFKDNCKKYWDAGLPAMPLKAYSPDGGTGARLGKPTGKEPVLQNWQSLQNRMPSEVEKMYWERTYPHSNIGLPLGPQSGLIAIDIDTDDPKLMAIFDRVLPPSPWVRVGKKGKVLVYRHDGQKIIRLKYIDSEGKSNSVIEMLSAGSQIVLPPSIHPDTTQPYRANANLWDVLDQVVPLPANTEARLRDELTRAGVKLGNPGHGAVSNRISLGNRDNRIVSLAGLFARDVLKGEKTLIEALGQIIAAAENLTEKVHGDNVDAGKGPDRLIEFLIRDVTGPKGRPLPKGWDEGLTPDQRRDWGLDIFDPDKELQDAGQLHDYFKAHIEKAGVRESTEQFNKVVRNVLEKMIDNPDLRAHPMEEDALIKFMADASGRRLTVAAIRRQLAAMRQGPIAGLNHAEIAQEVVKDLVELHGEIRYCFETLWHWTGDRWTELNEADVLKHIVENYGSMRAGAKSSDHGGILRTIKTITRDDLKKTYVKGINFINGFLTEDMEMKLHHPDYGMTYVLPYAYEPEKAEGATRWFQMLSDYWGNDHDYVEKVQALREAICMTLFGMMTDAQTVVCLYGVAGSGKSRIMEIVQALMPKEASVSVPPEMWGEKFGPHMLAGKLLNFAGELSETKKIASAPFKLIVDGAVINAQDKNKPAFNFRPECAHWFASNHTPKSDDSTEGFTRRWLFLTFLRAFPKNRKILNYDKLVVAEEREAIAAWAVGAMWGLREDNFRLTDPPSSQEQREALENELNSVRDFLATFIDQGNIVVGPDAHHGIADHSNFSYSEPLFQQYKSFAIAGGVSPVSSKVFEKRLLQLQGNFGFKYEKLTAANGLPLKIYRHLTLNMRKAS